jgi:hypothetical protein
MAFLKSKRKYLVIDEICDRRLYGGIRWSCSRYEMVYRRQTLNLESG